MILAGLVKKQIAGTGTVHALGVLDGHRQLHLDRQTSRQRSGARMQLGVPSRSAPSRKMPGDLVHLGRLHEHLWY